MAGSGSSPKSPRNASTRLKPPRTAHSDEIGEEFEVEQIVAKRTRKGRVEYLVKWLDYDANENTWQPIDTMDCPDLIDQFEREQSSGTKRSLASKKSRSGKSRSNKSARSVQRDQVPSSHPPWSPGDWEDSVAAIDTVTKSESGNLHVWIQWQNGEISEELASEANVRCPQKIIAFYESRLRFPADKR